MVGVGVLRIETTGSFPYRAKHFGATEWGHAHAVAEAIAWLSSEVLPAAIAQDHRLHESGAKPRLGFDGRPPQRPPPTIEERDERIAHMRDSDPDAGRRGD